MIVLVAIVLRAGSAWMSGVAAPQEIRYITIAEGMLAGRGFQGIDTRFPDIIQPPVFPSLIALAMLVSPDPLAAARGVSVLAGALLVLLVAILSRRLFGDAVAVRAAWLAAVYPLLVHISGLAMTEPVFSVFVAAAALFAHRVAYAGGGASHAAGAGLCLGLGFLTRPEGLAYVAMVCPALFLILWRRRRMAPARAAALAAVPALVVLVFAGTYSMWVHSQTGRWIVAPKALLTQVHNKIMTEGVREGWPERYGSTIFYERVKFGLNEEGTELRSAALLRKVGLMPGGGGAGGTGDLAQEGVIDPLHLVGVVLRNLNRLYLDTIKYGLVMPSLVLVFLVLGIVSRPWSAGSVRTAQVFLWAFVLSGGSWVFSYVQPRFLYPSIPFLLPIVGEGWVRAERWLADSFPSLRSRSTGRLARPAVLALGGCLAAASLVHAVGPARTVSSTWRDHREAGLWLRNSGLEPAPVMALTAVAPFYAGMPFEVMPYAEIAELHAYAVRRGARYLIADMVEFPRFRPRLMPLMDPNAPTDGFRVLQVIGDDPEKIIVIHEVAGRNPLGEVVGPSGPSIGAD